jgi:hypothetical protein
MLFHLIRSAFEANLSKIKQNYPLLALNPPPPHSRTARSRPHVEAKRRRVGAKILEGGEFHPLPPARTTQPPLQNDSTAPPYDDRGVAARREAEGRHPQRGLDNAREAKRRGRAQNRALEALRTQGGGGCVEGGGTVQFDREGGVRPRAPPRGGGGANLNFGRDGAEFYF